jgi:hypothetical protein
MFDIYGRGLILWDEINSLLQIFMIPKLPIHLIVEWAFVFYIF